MALQISLPAVGSSSQPYTLVGTHRPLITHRGTRRAERYAAPGKGQSVTPIGGRSR